MEVSESARERPLLGLLPLIARDQVAAGRTACGVAVFLVLTFGIAHLHRPIRQRVAASP
jgi:hypothetical protein